MTNFSMNSYEVTTIKDVPEEFRPLVLKNTADKGMCYEVTVYVSDGEPYDVTVDTLSISEAADYHRNGGMWGYNWNISRP